MTGFGVSRFTNGDTYYGMIKVEEND